MKIKLILTLTLSLLATACYASANKQDKIKHIAEIIDSDVLVGCNYRSPYWVDIYFSDKTKLKNNILYIDNRDRQGSAVSTNLPTLKISGIKAKTKFKRRKNNIYEQIVSYDVDVFTHGLHVMRFAIFDADDIADDTEYRGYYYILKGSPKRNLPKLKRLAKQSQLNFDVSLERTKANNTRVRCIF